MREKVPSYLSDIIEEKYEGGMLRQINIKTPSGQFWNKLSSLQRDEWRKQVEDLGADPEDFLAHMREMLPDNPKWV